MVTKAKKQTGPERIQEDLLPLAIDIDSPVLDPRNARDHPEENLDQIKLSLLTYGQCKPVVVNKTTGVIEAGNGMVIAARELGWHRIAVARADHDAVQAMAYGIMDNKSGLSSEWNLPNLKDNLQELDTGQIDMSITGFSEAELEELMTQVHPGGGMTIEPEERDEQMPTSAPARAKLGDTWRLGAHRLVCGDMEDSATLARLIDGRDINMVFTDPPYGIESVGPEGHIGGGSKGVPVQTFRQVMGDDAQRDLSFLLPLAPAVLIWGGNYYAHTLPLGGVWLVWNKERAGQHSFSDCELVWTNLPGVVVKMYDFMWDGFRREGPREEEAIKRLHPNQKAVAVLANIMNDYGRPEDVALDPYGGSGSTPIACEKIGRTCLMGEKDPLYCDVIIQRWQEYTGGEAVREGG